MECLVFSAYFPVYCPQKFPTPVKKRIFKFLYCMSLLEVRKCVLIMPPKIMEPELCPEWTSVTSVPVL